MEVMEDLFWNKVKFLIKQKNYAYVYSFSFSKFSFLLPLSLKNLPLSKERNAWKVVAGDVQVLLPSNLSAAIFFFILPFGTKRIALSSSILRPNLHNLCQCLGFREQSAETYAQ